jgi:hypothetical protein
MQQNKLEALMLLQEDIPTVQFNKLKRKYEEELEITSVKYDSGHFEKIKTFLEGNIRSKNPGEELLPYRIVDSRIGKNAELEYLIVPIKKIEKKIYEKDDETGEWKTLDHFKSSWGANIIRSYETLIQLKMGLKYYDENRDKFARVKNWFMLCYDRGYEDDSREYLEKLVRSEKDVLSGGVLTAIKGEDPFIPKHSKKMRSRMEFGDPIVGIPKPDNANFTISSPNRTHTLDMIGVMLDTGCDSTEVDTDTINTLKLSENYLPNRIVVNKDVCDAYVGCFVTIGNTTVPIELIHSSDDDNLLGRDVYNAFKHDVNPKASRHTWIDQ